MSKESIQQGGSEFDFYQILSNFFSIYVLFNFIKFLLDLSRAMSHMVFLKSSFASMGLPPSPILNCLIGLSHAMLRLAIIG